MTLFLLQCLIAGSLLQESVFALQSTNYQIDESTIGNGGLVQSSSENYQGIDATGDIGVGDAKSSNYQINVGTNTPDQPNLSVSIDTSGVGLTTFSSSTPSTGTAQFSVLNYTSYGYVVYISGTPPKMNNYTIPALEENTASQAGVGQYGINLATNTLPVTFGADPDNGDFGHGEVNPNYATPDEYRFVSGEAIAFAPRSSGKTTYTISYIVNVEGLTPGGTYVGKQSIIVTGTY